MKSEFINKQYDAHVDFFERASIGKKPIQKWEYKIIRGASVLDSVLNELGENGWELTCARSEFLYFKKPKP